MHKIKVTEKFVIELRFQVLSVHKIKNIRDGTTKSNKCSLFFILFFSICPPLGLLPVLGPLERSPTLDAADST